MGGEQLRVTEGKEGGRLLSVEGELLIGRQAEQDEGRLGGDPEISRRHARVVRGADRRLTIEDLGSANGTFVNGERIDGERLLGPGDVVRIGRTVLEVTAGSGAAPDSPPAPAPAPAAEAAAEQAAVVLIVTDGAARGRRLTVQDELVIGRGVAGEGRLGDDRGLSRRHARIARSANGELTIEDLGSANGTFVNGERVVGCRVLELGDSVQIGLTRLQLTDAGRALPAPSPPAVPGAPIASKNSSRADAGRDRLAPELPIGSVFARCRVEGVISHGDMGVVYKAEELALQRDVALKLILPEHSRDESFRERFRRESRIAAAIDHQNVIPIFDAGDQDGVLYIIMRLVDGTDMRALIAAEGRLEPLRAARIIRQVGAALDAAHARGMIHRDVKPSNVLLARRDHVYLTDFGLAKQASVEGLTRRGSIASRAEYVAPEQVANEPVDGRADIYALGCVLFEALTGEPPFAMWTLGPRALAHLDAARPSPLDLRPELPPEFDEVIRRAMARDPDDRYPSAGDLGQAALVAAGGLRRARPWSIVATGEAAPVAHPRVARPPAGAPHAPAGAGPAPGASVRAPAPGASPASEGARPGRVDVLRWAIALASLAIVAIGMVAALQGISTL